MHSERKIVSTASVKRQLLFFGKSLRQQDLVEIFEIESIDLKPQNAIFSFD